MLLFAAAMIAAAPLAPPASGTTTCPRTTQYYAWQRGKSVKPQKLNELPPARGYMAVYRHVGGCEMPMTVTEYRQGGRR
jgi:hypothetical protein